MGHKIFVSYKYHDTSVYQTIDHRLFEGMKERLINVRDYVDVLETYVEEYSDHYWKGEENGEPLDDKSDDWIWEHLKTLMFDSTLTIIMISPNMKENISEKNQWIPWEVSYSLGNKTRKSSTGKPIRSVTNAMLAIVLPDVNNSYQYFFETRTCCESTCRLHKTNSLFKIIGRNTFNLLEPESNDCKIGDKIYHGNMYSYIPFYRWDQVNSKDGIEAAIDHAFLIQSQKEKYKINYEIE